MLLCFSNVSRNKEYYLFEFNINTIIVIKKKVLCASNNRRNIQVLLITNILFVLIRFITKEKIKLWPKIIILFCEKSCGRYYHYQFENNCNDMNNALFIVWLIDMIFCYVLHFVLLSIA